MPRTGDQLIRPDELYSDTILVLKGDVRLIAFGDESEGPFSLGKEGQASYWLASLLRGESTEFVQASTEVIALVLPGKDFIDFIVEVPAFADYFHSLQMLKSL